MKLTSTPFIAIVFILSTLSIVGCKKDEGPSQREKDEQIIQTYIEDFNLDAQPTGSGLYVVIDEEGAGVNPTVYDEVSVFYRGALTSGEVFDLTGTEPAVFPLSQVIEGWQEGIPYFKPGGSGTLLIPSHLGYGSQSAGSIPPNSVLVFDITLVRVN
ncbi:MAG: FKBP-type peptidyl-prolyl cis-trans isomerase [Flavobacteriales bacterium]|nr:FKBP-type peptidyl-prolyl cis-trans isomerase [Flavobacteriales bacterium]